MTSEVLDGVKILQINWLYSFKMAKDIIEKSIQLFNLLYMTCLSNNKVISFFHQQPLREIWWILRASVWEHQNIDTLMANHERRVSLAVSEPISSRQELELLNLMLGSTAPQTCNHEHVTTSLGLSFLLSK